MALPLREEVCVEAGPPRPLAVLRLAENEAIQIAKFLRENREVLTVCGGKASVEDAVNLADSIAALAAMGQQVSAEEAIDIESRVEVFLDILARNVDRFLVSTR